MSPVSVSPRRFTESHVLQATALCRASRCVNTRPPKGQEPLRKGRSSSNWLSTSLATRPSSRPRPRNRLRDGPLVDKRRAAVARRQPGSGLGERAHGQRRLRACAIEAPGRPPIGATDQGTVAADRGPAARQPYQRADDRQMGRHRKADRHEDRQAMSRTMAQSSRPDECVLRGTRPVRLTNLRGASR